MFSSRISLKALLVATVAAVCATGVVTDSAKAITWGSSGHGQSSGYVFCDQVGHQLTFSYSAQADTTVLMGQNSSAINVAGTSTLIVNPVWIQVASYVKPASYGSWVLMHTDTLYINTAGSKVVTRLTVPAGRGNYWTAGFMVRVASPGGQWSQWFWEPAVPYMTLSGNNSAPYGFCLT